MGKDQKTNTKQSIEVGDTVKLASGGYNMTVNNVTKGYADCVWFSNDSDAFPLSYKFNIKALNLVTKKV